MIKFFKEKKKENLLTGTLLFISAVISLIPGTIHLINGMNGMTYSIILVGDYVSVIIFSLLMMLASLVLFSIAYLLWEGHSLGWKLSIATCGIAVLIAVASSTSMYFAVPIALLSGLAATLEIRKGKKLGNQTNDSPVVTENVVKLGLRLSAITCVGIVVAMVVFVVVMGTPFLSLQFFTSMTLNFQNVSRICWGLKPIGQVGGVLSYVLGSLLLVSFCEFIAVPIGVGAAIYLAEYSPSQSRVVSTIRLFIETLAGSPSVVIAIIGFAIFIVTLKWDQCLWAAAVSLSFMALPWNIRISEEAMKSVPRSYREASFALGATQWQTARLVTLYAALPGIITGILLGIGVALGETLILLSTYSGAATYNLPSHWWYIFNIRQQLPSLTVFILEAPGSTNVMGNIKGANNTNVIFYSFSLAFAAATVLIAIYLTLCIGALLLRNYLNKRMKGS
jgi:phosphate transport system permease protein